MRGREGGGFTSVIERVVRCFGRVGDVVFAEEAAVVVLGRATGREFVFVGSRCGRVDILGVVVLWCFGVGE